ncbi:MAG: hypothetical protein HON43_01715 [Alphaproteobacteria bacterium]|nr:hypothetical protein [Alphaproteobacteria bacterium]MBT5390628.1 hypothetical protein [Alphaproteobacteria bacterium]MBT5540778.1 hypothetical protein [Alphaproteobacteria bacterium]
MEKGHSQRLEEIQTLGDIQEAQSLHSHARPTGVPFIDGLAGSVRPIITYAFFLLYAAIKVAQLLTIQHLADQLTWTQALLQIWHMEDQALFATVMSFWFGQRALAKFGHKSK